MAEQAMRLWLIDRIQTLGDTETDLHLESITSEHTDRRRTKRALTADEFWRLIDVARQQPNGGVMRALYYWLAGRAGLRWTEIKRLRRQHLKLGTDPCLMLTADITKSGRDNVVILDVDLADALRVELSHSFVLFRTMPARLTWRRDLERTGIPWETEDGFAYRSCLRTTFITHMYEAGVHIVDAAERARHSDINLTRRVLYQGEAKPSEGCCSHPTTSWREGSESGCELKTGSILDRYGIDERAYFGELGRTKAN